MKKIFAIAAVAAAMLFAGKANAQLNAHVAYAPQTYKTTVGSNETSKDYTGFIGGLSYNINLSGKLGVSPGFYFQYNTSTDSDGLDLGIVRVSGKSTSTQMLFAIPVLFNYGFVVKRDIKIAPFIGPTFSYAFSGKTKGEGSANFLGIPVGGESEYDWYGSNAMYKPFSIALTFGLCADLRDFRLFGGYNLGLLNIDARDNYTTKGTNWFVGLGYNL